MTLSDTLSLLREVQAITDISWLVLNRSSGAGHNNRRFHRRTGKPLTVADARSSEPKIAFRLPPTFDSGRGWTFPLDAASNATFRALMPRPRAMQSSRAVSAIRDELPGCRQSDSEAGSLAYVCACPNATIMSLND